MKNTFQRCAARTVLIIAFAAFLYSPSVALAGPILGTTLSTFAMLGGAGVAVNGTGSVITGSVGGCCNAFAITGWPANFTDSGGTVYTAASSVTNTAHNELITARTALNLLGPGITKSSLDNLTLAPGVYTVSATNFTGNLTLDGFGNANALWVFLFASSLTTASSSNVSLQNTGAGAGVYWVVGSSANLGSNSVFAGNILAYSSTAVTGTTVTDCGRLLTETASVTLAGTDTIGIGNCSGIMAGSNGLSGGGTLTLNANGIPTITTAPSAPIGGGQVPEPGTVPLLCGGLLALTFYGWQSRKRVA
jgi:hypothetical protein